MHERSAGRQRDEQVETYSFDLVDHIPEEIDDPVAVHDLIRVYGRITPADTEYAVDKFGAGGVGSGIE